MPRRASLGSHFLGCPPGEGKGPRVPPSRCSVSPFPSPISARAVGGRSPDPTLPLQPDPRTPADPRTLLGHPKSSSPTARSGEEEGAPPWVRDEVEGCHTDLRPRAESLLPQGGKTRFYIKKAQGERLWGARGVSRGDAEEGAGSPYAAGGTRRQCPAGMEITGWLWGCGQCRGGGQSMGGTGGAVRVRGAELAHGGAQEVQRDEGHGSHCRTGSGG